MKKAALFFLQMRNCGAICVLFYESAFRFMKGGHALDDRELYQLMQTDAERGEELPPPCATFCMYFWDAVNPADAVEIGFENSDTVIPLE